MKKLLLTAGGSPGQEAIYRHLNLKYELYFCDSNISNISPAIPSQRRITIPRVESQDYEQTIIQLCNELGIDLLVPGVDEELMHLQAISNLLKKTLLFLPEKKFVESMLSKSQMARAFENAKLNIPRTYPVAAAAPVNSERLVVVKPDFGRGSRDVFLNIKGGKATALVEALGDVSKVWVVQEQVFGDEYTVQMISSPNSTLVAIIPLKVFEKRGSTVAAATDYDQEVMLYCEQIHDAFKPCGSYNIQLIKEKSGSVYAFEINPRISTTMVVAIAAGIDPFEYFLDERQRTDRIERLPDVHLHRHWTNVITVEKK